jgi:hypothetical protein
MNSFDGSAESRPAGERVESMTVVCEPRCEGRLQSVLQTADGVSQVGGRGNDAFGRLAGGERPHVGREVGERYVDFVPDP